MISAIMYPRPSFIVLLFIYSMAFVFIYCGEKQRFLVPAQFPDRLYFLGYFRFIV